MFLNSGKKDKIALEKHRQIEEKLLNLFTKQEVNILELENALIEMRDLQSINLMINLKHLSFIKKREVGEELLSSYENVKNEISNCLVENKVPTIHIDKWIIFLNLFSNEILEKKWEIKTKENSNQIAMLSNNEEIISLSFKNGKKTILSVENFDLTEFTHDELIEILRLLDVMISDNKYDFLRTEIAKQIASISSISSIRNI